MLSEGKEEKKKKQNKHNKKRIAYIVIVILLLTVLVLASTSDIFTRWYIPDNLAPSIALLHPNDDEVITGINTTYFNWTGSDPDGDTLYYVLYIDQLHTFSSPMRRNIDVGTSENHTPNPFMDGHWYWRVECTDTHHVVVSETRHLIFRENLSNSFPTLSDMQVTPSNGDTQTDFVYSAIYTDLDNTSADYIRVYIDGTNYTMVESDASDITIDDGKTYQYTTKLGTGLHNYSFACSDGNASTVSNLYNGPYVSKYVSPPSGGGGGPGEKMNKVTIQPKNNIGYPGKNFYGNLAITEESYSYEYEVYWYIFLLDSNDNEIGSNSGSLAIQTSVTVAYDISIHEEIEKGSYQLIAKTYDEPRSRITASQLGMDTLDVKIKEEPIGNEAVEEVKANEFLQYFLIIIGLIFAILAVIWTRGVYLVITVGVILLLLLVFNVVAIQFFSVLGIILIMAGCLLFTRFGEKIPINIPNLKLLLGAFLIFIGFVMYSFPLI